MAGNPVQVVMTNYVQHIPPEPGGSEKDFYAGKDAEFAVHRQGLVSQLASADVQLVSSGLGGAGIIKVKMRKEALAKSHAPTNKIFKPDICRQVGAGGLGELFFEVDPDALKKITKAVQDAEPETKYKPAQEGKAPKPNPSQLRSEVGAIERIDLPHVSDKRKFSVQQAVEWLSRPDTAGVYLIDLFYLPRSDEEIQSLTDIRKKLVTSFFTGLRSIHGGVAVYFGKNLSGGDAPVIMVGLTKGRNIVPSGDIPILPSPERRERIDVDLDPSRHQALFTFLDSHPLVRQILLPPQFKQSHFRLQDTGRAGQLPAPVPQKKYPKLGLIDGGVSSIADSWKLGTHDLLASQHKNEEHGTFIAGLLIGAKALNNHVRIACEEDGCQIFDIAIMPDENQTTAFRDYFPSGIEDFLQEVRSAVEEAKRTHGIRVFNFSLNVTTPVNPDDYSPLAAGLDRISRENDVIFVISAGNLRSNNRAPWPADPARALALLAARTTSDPLLPPAESVTSLTVGAVNPPNVAAHVEGTPTCYTTRGPGLRVGLKPDLAHYGGAGTGSGAPHHHGLVSLATDGALVSDLGTSFAAPLVSKTLASLDAQISGTLPRETLIALMAHNASMPEVLTHKSLFDIARQFVGLGIPSSSSQMLETGGDRITLIFSGVVRKNHELRFKFEWPTCLYDPIEKKCLGNVLVTLVYSPPLKRNYGAEFIRVNVDAHLRQKKGEGHWSGKLKPAYLNTKISEHVQEKGLIEYGLKWWPIKTYNQNWKQKIGGSSEWMLVVDSLARANEEIPAEGVPFSVIMTIADPTGNKPVFNQFRQWLTAHNVQCNDIKTATTIRPRT